MASHKRKRVALTVSEKLELIQLQDKSTSYAIISEQYWIGRSTIIDIKKNRDKIIRYKKKAETMGRNSVCELSTGGYKQYHWYVELRLLKYNYTMAKTSERLIECYS